MAASRTARNMRTSSSSDTRPSAKSVTPAVTRAVPGSRVSGSPTSVAETASAASSPMARPSWSPKAAPAMDLIMPPRAPTWRTTSSPSAASRLIWLSSAPARASVAAAATGAHSSCQVGRVRSTQSDRLQASRAPGAGMKSVAVSSHRSATRRAWRVPSASAAVTSGSPWARAVCRARSLPMSQLTGSSEAESSICCIWARSAIICPGLIEDRSGMAPMRASSPGSIPEARSAPTASAATC